MCVFVGVSWGQGLGLGGRELRVGSNIMFFIYCCFSYGTCTLYFLCILYIVSCPNYLYYISETYKTSENVVKHNEFVYTRERKSAIQMLSIIIIILCD